MPRFARFSLFSGRRAAALLLLLLLVARADAPRCQDAAPGPAPVKYVFLFIGDGMALPQQMLANEFLRVTEKRGLSWSDMPFHAVTRNHSANSLITDSAASATAIACGEKTDNNRVGVAPDGRRLESVAEAARGAGRKVGVISSENPNNTTPACFYAHNKSRSNYYEIGLDMIASNFDYFGGGRLAYEDDEKSPAYKGNLYELAREAGYAYFLTEKEFRAVDEKPGDGGKIIAAVNISYAIDALPGSPRLPDFVRQAIARLDNPRGFFLMAEGAKIDWAGHQNDAATLVRDIMELDEAVRAALDFADKHPDDTLIVVTGDHETGGLTIMDGYRVGGFLDSLALQKASKAAIAARIKSLGKERGEGMAFADLHPTLTENTGLHFAAPGKAPVKDRMALTGGEQDELERIFAKKAEDFQKMADQLADAVVRLVNKRAGVAFSTGGHAALPVLTSARGPGAQAFSGAIDNTDLGKLLKELVR